MPFFSFPVLKYSWATTSGMGDDEVSWEHLTAKRLTILLHSDTFGSSSTRAAIATTIKVLHDEKVLENISVETLCRATQVLMVEARAQFRQLSSSELLVSAIVRTPLVAMKYRSEDSKVHRMQLKLSNNTDYDLIVQHLEALKCPIIYSQERPNQSTMQHLQIEAPRSLISCSETTDRSLPPTTSTSSETIQGYSTLMPSNRYQNQTLNTPSFVLNKPAQDLDSSRQSSLHRSMTLPYGAQQDNKESVRPSSSSITDSLKPHNSSSNHELYPSSHYLGQVSIGENHLLSTSALLSHHSDRISQPFLYSEGSLSPVHRNNSNYRERPGSMQAVQRPATAPLSHLPVNMTPLLPPRRILPFGRQQHLSHLESVKEHEREVPLMNSSLNLPPLPAPTFSHGPDLANTSRLAPTRDASASYRNMPSVAGKNNVRNVMKLIDDNSVSLISADAQSEQHREFLERYAAQPEPVRDVVLEDLMCKYINDNNFLRLCQDVENSWKRFGLDREN